jgi:hypothetical protein
MVCLREQVRDVVSTQPPAASQPATGEVRGKVADGLAARHGNSRLGVTCSISRAATVEPDSAVPVELWC